MRNIHYITFGGGSPALRGALKTRQDQARRAGFFLSITTISDIDLTNDHDFWISHGDFIKNNPRGYGYWLWKPYIILKHLSSIQEGDILYYADVGCEVNRLGGVNLDRYNDIIDKQDILLFELNHPARKWTKGDLLSLFPDLRTRNQLVGGVIGLKACAKSRDIIESWFELCSRDGYHYLDDSPSNTDNDEIFREHRHDQACLTAAVTAYDNIVFLNESEFYFDTMADKPFLVLRNRTEKLKTIQIEILGKKYIILKRRNKLPKLYSSKR